jgi:hypothetical protein
VSRPLAETRLYRPGPLLAAAVVLAPALLALAGAAISLRIAGTVPVWLPLVLLLWIPSLAAAWIGLISVRTTPMGIAAARPWQEWRELPWGLIDRADRYGPLLRLRASDGAHLSFAPFALQDGMRLHREILMRLPANVLDSGLREAARDLLGDQVVPRSEGGLDGIVRTRPRARWRWVATGLGLLAAAGGCIAALTLPIVVAGPIAALAALAVAAAVAAFRWFSQQLSISSEGITVTPALGGRQRSITWGEIELIEHTPGEGALRLRGERRLRCVGPTALRLAERDAMRAFLHEYCISHGVPVVQRRWLL